MLPSTAQFGTLARVVVASTPYGQTGLFADLHGRALAGELEGAFAQHASSAEMNPTLDRRFLADEEARDPDSFRAEYLAEFLGSGDAYLDFDRIDPPGAPPAPPEAASEWVAGLDPAFARDPFGLALVGRAGDELVVGPVRALRAEGDFGGVVDEAAETCRAHGARVITDQFSSAAVVERLRQRHGLTVAVHPISATSKTAIFAELRARLYDASLRLPDHPRLTAELRRLRTRYTAGSATVVNPRVGGSHGDIAQALALAVFELRQRSRRSWVPLGTASERPKLRRQGLILEADGRIRLMTEAEKAEHERRRAEEERAASGGEGRRRTPTPVQSGGSGAER
jgi:hypothetical protein